MNWQLKYFYELSADELYMILQLRSEVFVIEQTCIYQDMDGLDKQAFHLYGIYEGQLVAYARLIPPGVNYIDASIGRVIVSAQYRTRNFGRILMSEAITHCGNLFQSRRITISAQLYLLKFYQSLGFKESGESYLEDEIPHIKMIWEA